MCCWSGRVKVLETGDGRYSRFSGDGAAIRETFQHEHKLDEVVERAVLVENKKLTHDRIVECGFAHLRPLQACFPRVYDPDLAQRIVRELGTTPDGVVVLKLLNRARGAGVVPTYVSELDGVLRTLLDPPEDIEDWLANQDEDWYINLPWGTVEEQVRHWWSSETPCFIAEELCRSKPTIQDDGRELDGTMRVGFSLHRGVDTDNASRREDASWVASWGERTFATTLFPVGVSALCVAWLGGYWKLPVAPTDSSNLRDRIVSVAKKGTAPVATAELNEVYAMLGGMVEQLFGTSDFSHVNLTRKYASFPELASFFGSRLAGSVRRRNLERSQQMLQLALSGMANCKGLPRDAVVSYIERNRGALEALTRNWPRAADYFRKSLVAMPTNATSRYLLGMYYLDANRPIDAAICMAQSLQLDPDFKAAYSNIGVAYLRLGQYERTVKVSGVGMMRHLNTPHFFYHAGLAHFALACKQERAIGGGCVAAELRSRALSSLESAIEHYSGPAPFTPADEKILHALRMTPGPLNWPQTEMPRDGWRLFAWRP
eukprot:NODE_867_length_2726_cov_10.400923.p1 GENE.NODE_867_length_2726_cov_10.400923~~NODE_867_length_2726_cov_10.400923.p1  ORF type:complete len:545 (-),score=136.31 NODE_867_length_2726_cov_10.400923:326-1960(-)